VLLAHDGKLDPDVARLASSKKAFLKQNALFYLQVKKRVSAGTRNLNFSLFVHLNKTIYPLDAARKKKA
jgi:hypothetical protein